MLDRLASLVKAGFPSLAAAYLSPVVAVQVVVKHRIQHRVASGAVGEPVAGVVALAGVRVRTTALGQASTLAPPNSSPVRVQDAARSATLMARRKVVAHEATKDQEADEEVKVAARVPAVHLLPQSDML